MKLLRFVLGFSLILTITSCRKDSITTSPSESDVKLKSLTAQMAAYGFKLYTGPVDSSIASLKPMTFERFETIMKQAQVRKVDKSKSIQITDNVNNFKGTNLNSLSAVPTPNGIGDVYADYADTFFFRGGVNEHQAIFYYHSFESTGFPSLFTLTFNNGSSSPGSLPSAVYGTTFVIAPWGSSDSFWYYSASVPPGQVTWQTSEQTFMNTTGSLGQTININGVATFYRNFTVNNIINFTWSFNSYSVSSNIYMVQNN